MKLTDLFLDELEREAAGTRRALQRVPDGRNDWKPHEKSMRFGYLAVLVASMPGWIDLMVHRDELDLSAADGGKFRPKEVATNAELLQIFEESLAKGRAALKSTTDDHLMTKWKFVMGGRPISEEPRYVMIRDSVLNHWAHHRGQLTVYLRLTDAPVPAIYGPSADEGMGS